MNNQIKRYLKFLITLITIGNNVFAQGNTCADAVTIDALPYNSPAVFGAYSTCGAGDDYSRFDRCANRYIEQEEFVFEFTPAPGIYCINALVETTGMDPTGIFISEGCPDDPNSNCVAQFVNIETGLGNKPSNLTNVYVTPGVTYYLMVIGATDCITFSLELTEGICGVPPIGSTCEVAQEITSLPATISNTTCDKLAHYMYNGNECDEDYAARNLYTSKEHIIKFTADEDLCVLISGKALEQDLRIAQYNGCPTYTYGNCETSWDFEVGNKVVWNTNLMAGNTYYFVFSTLTEHNACTAFEITFETISSIGARCETAYQVSQQNSSIQNVTTLCKGDDYVREDGCDTWLNAGEEVVFEYESAGNECVVFQLSDIYSYYGSGGFFLYDKCPDDNTTNSLACLEIFTSTDPVIQYTFDTAGTYYLVVTKLMDFDFDLFVESEESLGATCENALPLASEVPIAQTNISTSCKGNNYGLPTDACATDLMTGSDYILTYTAPKDFCGNILMRNMKGNGGITVLSDCPDNGAAQCYGAVGTGGMSDSLFLDIIFEQGKTYTIVVSASYGELAFECDLEIVENLDSEICEPCVVDCEECVNANFEQGDLSNWRGAYGKFDDPSENNGFITSYINDPWSRHTIVEEGTHDEVVPQLMKTSPNGGRYAVRLGNRDRTAEGEQIAYTFLVTPDNPFFLYNYAVILENPLDEDPIEYQGYFEISMQDESGNPIDCGQYAVRATTTEDYKIHSSDAYTKKGRPIGNVYWKDWSMVAVPLDAQIGEIVTITFTTSDCALLGHMGYAYIDAFCGILEIEPSSRSMCSGAPVYLTAPDGFENYLWSTGETSREITVTSGGTYSVDAAGFGPNCNVSFSIDIDEFESPTADFLFQELVCSNDSAHFTDNSRSNDTTTITSWLWNFGDGSTSIMQNPIYKYNSTGEYDVSLIVETSQGCSDTITKNIKYSSLALNIDSISDVGCYNGSDGYIKLQIDSDTGYSVLFNGTATLASEFNNLDAGNYHILVTDDLGCSVDTSLTISQPKALTFQITTTNVLCNGNNTGKFSLTATGGTPPYSYGINPSTLSNDSIIEELFAGDYTVYIMDANGCTVQLPGTIAEPDAITSSILETTPSNCNTSTGSIKTNVTGGTAPLSYQWFVGSANTGGVNLNGETSTNLLNQSAGSYYLITTDSLGCADTLSANINKNTTFYSIVNTKSATCDSANGIAWVSSTPSSGNYSYQWKDANKVIVGQNNDSLNGQTFGEYSVFITDGMCDTTIHFTVENGGKLEASIIDIINPVCGESNGSATADVSQSSGGSISYLWLPSGQTEAKATNLETGNHTVTITDDFCSISMDTILSTPGSVSGRIDTIIPATCNLENGSITVIAESGSGNYTYQWYQMPGDIILDGATSATITNIGIGDYKVKIDDGTCAITLLASVTALATPQLATGNISPASCGLSNGQITVSSSSGLGTHTYAWFKADDLSSAIATGVSRTLAGLDSGCYAVVVYDDYCSDTLFNICVPYWEKVSVDVSDSAASYCGQNNGYATATSAGGSGNVQFNWYTSPLPGSWIGTGNSIGNLAPGCYAVIAEDLSYSCYDTASVCIADSSSPSLSITSVTASSCNDDNGSACVIASGGTGNYSYSWFDPLDRGTIVSSSNCINPAKPIVYRVVVFDGNCYDSLDITIPNDPAIDLSLVDAGDEYCESNDGFIEVLASLGTGAYNYSWYQTPDGKFYGNVARIDNITSGAYCVAVFDGQCHDTLCVTIDSIPSPIANLSINAASCEDSNGSAIASATGGTGGYNYLWYDAMYNQLGSETNISDLDSGNYTLIVTDDYCSDTVTFFIDMHESPLLTVVQITDAFCNEANGSAELSVSGGSGNYTFAWPLGINHTDGTDNTYSNELPAGNYCVIVDDGYCKDTVCFSITDPGLMTLSTNSNPDSCLQAKGSASVEVSGGTIPYSYLWSNGATTSSIHNQIAGNYNVVVTDANGCQQNDAITIGNARNTMNNSSFIDFNPNPAQARDTVKFLANINQHNWNPNSWYNNNGIFAGNSTQANLFYPSSVSDIVCLELIDNNQCLDTLCLNIFIEPNVAIYIPNAFTPNTDNTNELWRPNISGIIEMTGAIYDRWGKVVYRFNSIYDSWDGSTLNGFEAKQDVYAYALNLKDKFGKVYQRTGSVALIR